MKTFYPRVPLIVLFFISGCFGGRVKTHYDHESNFRTYRTFDWLPVPKDKFEYITDQTRLLLHIDAHVKETVKAELARKGIRRSRENPDFLIAYHTGEHDKLKIQDWGYAYARSSRYWGGRDDIEVTYYRQGTLILDFIDPKTKVLSWRGSVTKTVERGQPDEEDVRRRIRNAVKKILEKFPPRNPQE